MQTSPPPTAWGIRAVVRATLSVLAVALGFALVYRFSVVLMALFVAIVLATGILPVIDSLERRRVPRRVATSVAFALLSALVVGVGSLLGLPGALLAIPTAALAQLAVDRFLYRRRAVAEARARFTSLRSQLGALVAETDATARPSLAERDLRNHARRLALDFDRLLDRGARR